MLTIQLLELASWPNRSFHIRNPSKLSNWELFLAKLILFFKGEHFGYKYAALPVQQKWRVLVADPTSQFREMVSEVNKTYGYCQDYSSFFASEIRLLNTHGA